MGDSISNSFELVFSFEGDATDEQAETWMNYILESLPTGATGSIKREPIVIDIDDLSPEHEGYNIVIKRATLAETLHGRLDAVYPVANREFGRILVIDGRAHEVRPYEVATLQD